MCIRDSSYSESLIQASKWTQNSEESLIPNRSTNNNKRNHNNNPNINPGTSTSNHSNVNNKSLGSSRTSQNKMSISTQSLYNSSNNNTNFNSESNTVNQAKKVHAGHILSFTVQPQLISSPPAPVFPTPSASYPPETIEPNTLNNDYYVIRLANDYSDEDFDSEDADSYSSDDIGSFDEPLCEEEIIIKELLHSRGSLFDEGIYDGTYIYHNADARSRTVSTRKSSTSASLYFNSPSDYSSSRKQGINSPLRTDNMDLSLIHI
eukprot:TRINITY_DN3615_c0_g1_i13.p1 TRINITY_DN3615_c0_g1~~TRINITY_DN3615_c0_g1_i13.p1  ORF type:complete len:263 (+),score=47.67 TRINITY_DN3615_c0_g1_i13:66-854(+)